MSDAAHSVHEVVTWSIVAPGVMHVILARPPANALGVPLLEGLHAACDAAGAQGDVKVMVISSELEGFFAAGADIKHLSTIDADSFLAYGGLMRAVNDRIAASPWLSIAAIDGVALGGGLELALACTMRVSGPRGAFGVPEVKIGLIPGAGGTQRLPRVVGRARAIDMIITARQVPVAEAHQIGLVDRVTEGDVVEAALALASQLTRSSLPAQLAGVRSVDAAFDLPLSDGCDFEVTQEQDLFEHGEAAEGLSAFIAKRAPHFA
ncbi:enoyl-CoA hydratase [soil metagenome]